jgi:hypothetical protein
MLGDAVEDTAKGNHGRTGRKKLGGRKQICPTFSDFARQVPKKFSRRKLILTTYNPPPVAKSFGPKIFRTYQNVSIHRTNFPDISKFPSKLTQFPKKLTEFVLFF